MQKIKTYLRSLFIAVSATLLLGMGASAVQAASNSYYVAEGTLDVTDGELEAAWEDYRVVENDGEEDENRTRYCWNKTTEDWDAQTVGTGCETYLYDELGQIDLLNAWFGVNETNMYLAFETAAPMMALTNANGEGVSIYSQEIFTAGIDHLPNNEAFDHDMVFAFDTDPVEGEETPDYYVVAALDYNLPVDFGDLPAASDEDSFLKIYAEAGTASDDATGFDVNDTVLDSLNVDNHEASTEGETENVYFEVSQNIENFYDLTGISVGDEVGFRLETHSSHGDITNQVNVTFDQAPKVSVNSVVVGSSAKKAPKNRLPKKFGKGVVKVFTDSATDQSKTVEFTAYDKKVGVQVATGDVDGDGEQEIVTLPYKAQAIPRIKVYDLSGQLEYSAKVHKKKAKGLKRPKKSKKKNKNANLMVANETDETVDNIEKRKKIKRVKRYYLAVGDVNGDSRDDIVMTGATGKGVMIDVLNINDSGDLVRKNQFFGGQDVNNVYRNGVWTEVADLDQDGKADEIITTPFKGSTVVDIWSVSNNGTSLDHETRINVADKPGYNGGTHIGAADGYLVASLHNKKGLTKVYEFESGDVTTYSTGLTKKLGLIGNIEINNSGQLLVAGFKSNDIRKYNASGKKIYTLNNVGNRGAFIDFLEVE